MDFEQNSVALGGAAIILGGLLLNFLKGRGIDLAQMCTNVVEILKLAKKMEKVQDTQIVKHQEQHKYFIEPMTELMKDNTTAMQKLSAAVELNTAVMHKILEKD